MIWEDWTIIRGGKIRPHSLHFHHCTFDHDCYSHQPNSHQLGILWFGGYC
jgi:hypothetical protein